MIETARYDVIIEEGAFELRRYPEMLVAQVDSSVGSPFNRLFRYISGENKANTKISMTSPVITSEKIAMTSPVINASNSMAFVVPSKYNRETVPEPTDPEVTIKEVPERYIASVRFRGLAWKNEVEKQTNRLQMWLAEKEITSTGIPFLMQYNPPFIPGFLRRNEVGVEVAYEVS